MTGDSFFDYVITETAEILDGYDFVCEYLSDVDDECFMTCEYSCMQPQCLLRYFRERYQEEHS